MNQEEIEKGLTIGLLAGYIGNTKFTTINRGSFDLKSSHFEDKEIIYHDEWTDGGGQELVKINSQYFTRVYAGSVVPHKILTQLGITKKEVLTVLQQRIQVLGSSTRLFKSCLPSPVDEWGYSYEIIHHDESFNITTAKETITYKNQPVFVHMFLLSPIYK